MKKADIVIQKFKDAPIQIIDGDRGKNYPIDSELLDEGFCLFLNTGNVTESGFNFNNCQFISFDKDQILRKGKLKRNDLVMTTRGTVGNVGYYNNKVPFENIRINSGMVIFRVDQEEIIPSFFYQYLRSTYFNKQVNALRTGAAQPQLPIRDIKCIKIQIPQILEQEKIADILSSYDDFIDINRQRIQLLEESAHLLFREWFVYFKFPNHEKVKTVDGVPEGWKRVWFKDFVDFKEGPGLRNYQYKATGIPFLNIRTIENDDVDFSKVQYLDESEVQNKYKHFLLKEDDLVVSSSGTLGRVVTIRKNHLPLMLNTSLIRMRAKSEVGQSFLKAYLKYGHFLNQVTSVAIGAAQLNYGPSHLNKLRFVLPKQELINQYNEFTDKVFDEIKHLLDINQKLAQARDLLLPKLMRGEIRI